MVKIPIYAVVYPTDNQIVSTCIKYHSFYWCIGELILKRAKFNLLFAVLKPHTVRRLKLKFYDCVLIHIFDPLRQRDLESVCSKRAILKYLRFRISHVAPNGNTTS